MSRSALSRGAPGAGGEDLARVIATLPVVSSFTWKKKTPVPSDCTSKAFAKVHLIRCGLSNLERSWIKQWPVFPPQKVTKGAGAFFGDEA